MGLVYQEYQVGRCQLKTLFTRIIEGEIPCHFIHQDDEFFSFLDIRPIRQGHALVVPKNQNDYIFDQPESVLSRMLLFAKEVAGAIEKEVNCERIGLSVLGLEVPHTHLHLVPISEAQMINFGDAREANQGELSALAEKIRSHLN